MRLDKYLKVARILKRRTVSKELAANERVLIMQIRQLTTSDKNKIVEMIDNMLPNK